MIFLASVGMQETSLSTIPLSSGAAKANSSWFWLSGKVAWMCMCDVKGGRLLRWQVLKAAARERGYQGPTTHHCKLEVLMEKDKFRGFRRSLLSMKEEGM